MLSIVLNAVKILFDPQMGLRPVLQFVIKVNVGVRSMKRYSTLH